MKTDNNGILKTRQLVFIFFLLVGALYFIGSCFDVTYLYLIANILLIPAALLYYPFKTKEIFWPVVVALLFLYTRDLFLIFGFYKNPWIILTSFFAAMIILYLCVITGFQKSRIHYVEIVSLLIMYGFLGFLFYSISEMIPDVIPGYTIFAFVYLLLLVILVGFAFTRYLLKSHWASLWFMVGSGSLLVSELSYFFKTFILADISVRIFFPFFHVLAVYAFVKFGINRRKTSKLPYF